MSIEGGPSPQEMGQERKNEIQIGGGDIIKVSSLREVVEKQSGFEREFEEQELPPEQLEEIREALSRLPFRIGEKNILELYQDIPMRQWLVLVHEF